MRRTLATLAGGLLIGAVAVSHAELPPPTPEDKAAAAAKAQKAESEKAKAAQEVSRAQDKARRGVAAGLAGMLERVSLLNGLLWIDSAPGEGTKVRACFPLQGGRG